MQNLQCDVLNPNLIVSSRFLDIDVFFFRVCFGHVCENVCENFFLNEKNNGENCKLDFVCKNCPGYFWNFLGLAIFNKKYSTGGQRLRAGHFKRHGLHFVDLGTRTEAATLPWLGRNLAVAWPQLGRGLTGA